MYIIKYCTSLFIQSNGVTLLVHFPRCSSSYINVSVLFHQIHPIEIKNLFSNRVQAIRPRNVNISAIQNQQLQE